MTSKQENNIFHGSMRHIEGAILPHKGRNPLGGKEFNQFGIYATPHFLSALVYSLSIERARIFAKKRVLIAYAPNQVCVKMQGCYWSRHPGYVYVIPASTFIPLNDYEWVSYTEVPILQTLEINAEQIDDLIAQKRIIIECDREPKTMLYKFMLRMEDALIKKTSLLWHYYWKKRQ